MLMMICKAFNIGPNKASAFKIDMKTGCLELGLLIP